MLKNFIYIFFSLFFFFNHSISNENKIVYVDVDKIISQSIAGKDLLKKIDNLDKKNASKFEKKQKELKDLEKNIIQQKNILSKSDFDKKVIDLQKEIQTFKNALAKSRNELNKKKSDATIKLVSKVNEILAVHASENSITLVLQKNSIIIGKTELDITDEILKIINKEIKSIKFN